jgi:elongation factor G
LNQRRGSINDSETRDEEFVAQVDVSLNDMFGYSGALRGMTQGKGEFSMEYKRHQPVMANQQRDMEAAYQKELAEKRAAKK